jgi:imidazolonepropionase-like amidohydrolase
MARPARRLALRALLGLALALPGITPGESRAEAPGAPIAIVGATLIDGTGSAPRPGTTVLVSGERIAAIGSDLRLPADARIVEATGKFLIPGLWDMHVHLIDPRQLDLFIANGVTGIRIMWGAPPHQEWRRKLAQGAMQGPRLLIASGILDGPIPIWRGSVAVPDDPAARRAVATAKRNGADFVKVYSFLPREAYFAIAQESKKLGMPFSGHVPITVSVPEASDAGQSSIEHLNGILLATSTREAEVRERMTRALGDPRPYAAVTEITRSEQLSLLRTFSEEKGAALFSRLARNGTWQTPTLTVLRSIAYLDDPSFTNDPRLKYVPAPVRRSWDPSRDFRFRTRTAEDYANSKLGFRKSLEIVGAMHRAGVRILAGTDVANPYCFPGFSLHDELRLLVEAGLKPMDALQAATRNPAESAGLLGSLGTVEVGKLADLVLLDADPLQEIGNTGAIRAVIANGRLLDREALDAMLARAEAAATSN